MEEDRKLLERANSSPINSDKYRDNDHEEEKKEIVLHSIQNSDINSIDFYRT